MRKFLFVLASTASLVLVDLARAQGYLPPVNPGIAVTPDYSTPTYVPPGHTAPGNLPPGYTWRDQRANEDWRNNTWREQRFDENWRNNNWRTERAMEDWRQRQNYEKQRSPNNATDRGSVGATVGTENNAVDTAVSECAIGLSEESCRARGLHYNPPNPTNSGATVGTKNNAVDRSVGECAIGSSVETCRARGQR